jgi:glycosyltransferase involved in cell wall biosynthesis
VSTVAANAGRLLAASLRLIHFPELWRVALERSKRLVKDPKVGGWSSRVDQQALFAHLRRNIGISRPTFYRVRLRQRLSLAHRPRVLHVIPNMWIGGSTQLVVDLHDYLGHRFEMEVVTSAVPSRGRHEGMKISVVPFANSETGARQHLARFRPHLVHVHYWGDVDKPWYRPFFDAAAELGCPIVQNINTPVSPYAAESVKRNVFVSQTVLDRYGSAAHSEVIHPGIDLDLFAPHDESDSDAYDAIGMVYRLERDKLNENSIEPFIEVVKRRPQTRAIIVGDGSLFAHFRNRVRQEALLDRFEFSGFVPYNELPAYFRRFKVFVVPVWQESFGQVVPFAMSMGLAVAGKLVGAIPEILGDTATLGADTNEIVSRILDLLEDRGRIDALGFRNSCIARQNFGVKRMAAAYCNVYKGVIPKEVELMPEFPPAVLFPL